MYILFLTDNFPPETNAPASRTHEHAREWVKAGHQVSVITCAPNFPSGKVYSGYRNRIFQQEMIDGIRVVRVWSYITANEGVVRRTLDYLSFMLSGILAGLVVKRPDAVVATSPQFFTAVAGYCVSRARRVPFVLEIRDLWPESIQAVGAIGNAFILSLLSWIARFLYRSADTIITVTEPFKRHITGLGIDGNKIHTILNGVDLNLFSPRPRDLDLARQIGIEGKFVVGYIGTHGMAHGLETALDAAEQLQENGDVVFLFIGGGAERAKLEKTANDKNLTNVIFIDSVPKAEMPRYWSLLNVSLVLLRKSTVFTTVIPSKIYESVAMGIPVILGVEGEAKLLVESLGVGLAIPPESARSLASAILQIKGEYVLALQLRDECLKAAHTFDRQRLAREMLSAIQKTVSL